MKKNKEYVNSFGTRVTCVAFHPNGDAIVSRREEAEPGYINYTAQTVPQQSFLRWKEYKVPVITYLYTRATIGEFSWGPNHFHGCNTKATFTDGVLTSVEMIK